MPVSRGRICFLVAVLGLCTPLLVHATSQTITAGIRFVAPITFTAAVTPSFGTFAAATSADGAGNSIIQGSKSRNSDIAVQNSAADGHDSIAAVTSIRFVAPIAFTTAVNPSLGTFDTGIGSRSFVLGTDGTISGTDAAAYTGGANAGSIVIQGSESQNIDIIAQNLVADGGVNIAAVNCDYGGAGSTDCLTGIASAAAPTTAGTTLLLGLSVTTTIAHSDTINATPAFDIIVSYN